MTTPVPRAAERLLETLGADPDFRDGLLGDLAEEHVMRAAWDGERAARRWYRREALRVAPHLLRDAVRRFGWRDARRHGRTALSGQVVAYAVHLALAGTMTQGITMVMNRTGATGHLGRGWQGWALDLSWEHPIRSAIAVLMVLALTGAAPVVSGFTAACLEDEAPLFPALALGVVQLGFLSVQLAIGFPGPTGTAWIPGPVPPPWLLACQCLLIVLGPAAGALLYVAGRRRGRWADLTPASDASEGESA